jgi:hypothetical protein
MGQLPSTRTLSAFERKASNRREEWLVGGSALDVEEELVRARGRAAAAVTRCESG